jgi:alkylation response protein AidB-like acyl-CoA dehydrogenase
VTTAQQDAERAGELAALREAVRDLIEGSGGTAAARRRLTDGPAPAQPEDAQPKDAQPQDAEPGYDEDAWRLLGTEMGLAGLGIAEDLGGAGGGLAELTVVAEELGRSLLPVPFFSSTVLAGQILARCPDTGSDVLARLSAGGELAAFAGTDPDGCWRPDRLPVQAQADGRLHGRADFGLHGRADFGLHGRADFGLHGRADFVLDGAAAAHLVVAARTPAGCDLFLVAGDAEGVRRRALETLDPTRAQASVSLDGAPGTPLTTGGAGAAAVTAGLDVALVVLAAEQVGGAAACLDLAVEYAKLRHQFSRPIGSFQAIKHKLADLLLLVEMGRSAVDRAMAAEHDPARLAEAAAVAKIWCSDAYTTVATENVQIHGGIGFTWEHDAHLYFRRARADEQLLGDATVHRERLAALLGW